MGPRVDTATIRIVLSTNRVDSGSFSSGCCAFRRTHTSADPIRLPCIRLALPLTLSLPSRLAPSGCDITPRKTIPPHSEILGGGPSARKPRHALDPCSGKFQPKQTVFTEQAFDVENRKCGTHARCCDGTTIARMYLSTEKVVRPEP